MEPNLNALTKGELQALHDLVRDRWMTYLNAKARVRLAIHEQEAMDELSALRDKIKARLDWLELQEVI